MNKKWIKTIAMTMALTLSLGALAACGGGGGDNSSTDKGQMSVAGGEGPTTTESGKLTISVFNGGYGLDWLDAISAEYMRRNPQVEITYGRTLTDRSTQVTALISGAAEDDLYITTYNIHQQIFNNNKDKLADLSSVYTNIGSKINADIKQYATASDGKQYDVPWATALLGILYHESYFAQNELSVPRTSNELLALCEEIKTISATDVNGPYAPFSYSANVKDGQCYWDYLFKPWMAQYETKANYDKYWDAFDKDGVQYSMSVAEDYLGVLRTLEIYKQLLMPENGYCHEESQEDSFTQAQTRFLDREAQMMVNGDWIVNEMIKGDSEYTNEELADIAFMKTPIISAIVETMPMWNELDGVRYNPTVIANTETCISDTRKAEYDAALCAIIDYVDGVTTTKPTQVGNITISDADIERIEEARNIQVTMATGHNMVVPNCSDKIELAKNFIEFIYSDTGIALYANNVYGTGLPVSYTPEQIQTLCGESRLLTTAYELISDATLTFYQESKNAVFLKGGLSPTYYQGTNFIAEFGKLGINGAISAVEYYENSKANIALNWDNILDAAGIE